MTPDAGQGVLTHTIFPEWIAFKDRHPAHDAHVWVTDARGLRHSVKHGRWSERTKEIWDENGNDWNGWTHWILFEEPKWTGDPIS